MSHYVVITGGRKADEVTREHVEEVLIFLASFYGKALRVLHGDAKGVDAKAAETCMNLHITVKAFPADWEGRGNQAGLERNEKMAKLVNAWCADGHTGEVIAFDGGRGTEHMCSMAEKYGLTLTRIPDRMSTN